MEQVEYAETIDVVAVCTPKTIGQLGVRQRHNINILAAKRGEELIPIPGGDYCFREGETMLVLGADRDVQKFLHF